MLKLEKKRHFIIHSDMFRQDILICFNMSRTEALKVLKKYNSQTTKKDEEYILSDENPKDSIEGTMFPLSRGYLIIMKLYKNRFRYNVCLALHELTHASHYILRNVRIPLSEDTEEAYTYLLENLMKQFLHKLY